MKRRTREKLPPIPPGDELLDMQWRDLAPKARIFFESLPAEVEDIWATTSGLATYRFTLLLRDDAEQTLARTAPGSALLRMRSRELQRIRALANLQLQSLAAALRKRIAHDWPAATDQQVFVMLLTRLKALANECAIELGPL